MYGKGGRERKGEVRKCRGKRGLEKVYPIDQEKEEMSRRVSTKENGESDVYWLLPSFHE